MNAATTLKLAHLSKKAIHYQIPLFRLLAADPRVEFTALFASGAGVLTSAEVGYGQPVSWAGDHLGGYRGIFLGGGRPGLAGADLVRRLVRERFDANAEFGFTGMTHKAKQPWEPGLFDGDENAIVDFKYSNSPKLTWWFDHHQSAFLTPQDAEHFRTHRTPHMFYEPDYKSCTKLIATVGAEKFGFDTKPLE